MPAMKQLVGFLVVAGWLLSFQGAWAQQNTPLDYWPVWRGPEQNGTSRQHGLPVRWNPRTKQNVLWFRDDVWSISSPVVFNGRLYIQARAEPGTVREGERVVCLDPHTGKTIWENRYNVYLSDVPDTRVSWSAVTVDPETGNVYHLGVCGLFQCIDGRTGKTLWRRSLHEEFGLLSTYGGRTNFPRVFEDMVLISGVVINWGENSRPAHRFFAFDKRTGQLRWFRGTRLIPYDTTYSTPFFTVLQDQAAMVFGSGDGQVWAFQPRTGKAIWKFPLGRRGLNVSPIVVDGVTYTGHSEENLEDNTMGAVIALDAQGKLLWKNKQIANGKSSHLYVDGRLYVVDDRGGLWIFDAKTGRQVGRRGPRPRANMKLGTQMRGSPVYADGHIYICTANGRWYVLQPTERGVRVVYRTRLPSGMECAASPVVAYGRIYLATTGGLFCLGSKEAKATSDPIPPGPKEPPVETDTQVAQVQIVPAEALLAPGGQQQFHVRLYNARGQFLRQARPEEVQFEVDANGQVNAQGTFTASPEARHVAARVTAKVGQHQSTARVRIIPPLPWKFDFEDGRIPEIWVGMKHRHVPVKMPDGNWALKKLERIPIPGGRYTKLGTRSQGWIGPIDLHDYTIQADFYGTLKDGRMPDMGLIAQRYALVMMGASQMLRIQSWHAQLRMAKSVPFRWQANRWYRMKFRAENAGDKVILRGKVWPREEPEPKQWQVVAEDPVPNRHGAPGFFGNAREADFFIDNVIVTPNEQ